MNERKDGKRTDGLIDRRMDEWMHAAIDRWMDL